MNDKDAVAEKKQPAPEAKSDPVEARSSAGVIVLQWLTYAFWGWLILALIWLMGVITSTLIADKHVDDMVTYAIAAVVVLLPIAFVTDLFYRRHEPVKKTGAATVIMVIHVVIFALIGIAVLVGTVFVILSMFISADSGSKDRVAVIVTSLFATVLYAAAFLRTLNPFKTRKLARIYGFTMLTLSIVVLAIGIFGPMAKAFSERQDRRIENNLYDVKRGVETYTKDEKKLPEGLNDVDYRTDGAEALVKDGLVRYEKVGPVTPESDSLSKLSPQAFDNPNTSYRYKLCVTYKGDTNQDDDYYDGYSSDVNDDYSPSLATYNGHRAGEVCYKLSTRS